MPGPWAPPLGPGRTPSTSYESAINIGLTQRGAGSRLRQSRARTEPGVRRGRPAKGEGSGAVGTVMGEPGRAWQPPRRWGGGGGGGGGLALAVLGDGVHEPTGRRRGDQDGTAPGTRCSVQQVDRPGAPTTTSTSTPWTCAAVRVAAVAGGGGHRPAAGPAGDARAAGWPLPWRGPGMTATRFASSRAAACATTASTSRSGRGNAAGRATVLDDGDLGRETGVPGVPRRGAGPAGPGGAPDRADRERSRPHQQGGGDAARVGDHRGSP